MGKTGFAIGLSGLALVTFVGCGSNEPAGAKATGGAEIAVLALSTTDVAVTTVTITGPGMTTSMVVPISKVDGTWAGRIGGIPAGTDRTFSISAADSNGAALYAGQITGVTIAPGQVASVIINAQQVAPASPRHNAAPVIDALVASALTVGPGDVVALRVVAHDPDLGDTIQYSWTASSGTLATPSAASTNWTAPATATASHITIDVSDQKNAHAKMSLDISVVTGHGKGTADVVAALNTWPVIGDVTADPTRINVGESAALAIIATDADGDPLSYAWTTDCAGSFSSNAVATPSFTLAAIPAQNSCTFSVQVLDGKGGHNEGSVAIPVGPAPVIELPPEIVSSYQSATTAKAADTVTLRVEATSATNSALAFAWTATQGTLGQPNSTARASTVVWTAPAVSGAVTITAAVTDASTGLISTVEFTVTLASTLAPYVPDANTVLLDHFEGATLGSILGFVGDGVCGTPLVSTTPAHAYVSGPGGLGQAIQLSSPTGQPLGAEGSRTYIKYAGGEILSIPTGTLEFWMNATTGPAGGASQFPEPGYCYGYTASLGVQSDSSLGTTAWNGFDIYPGVPLPLSTWVHVAVTWGGAGAKLYMNGNLVGTDPRTGGPVPGFGASLYLGHFGATSIMFDELRISNVQRTAFNAR